MQKSEKYFIPPHIFPALREAILLNSYGQEAPFIQNSDIVEGRLEITIHGFGEAFDKACELAGLAENNYCVIIAPPIHEKSQHQGVVGEHYAFRARLYHSGVSFHDEYGASYIHRLTDFNGNEYTWYSKFKPHPGVYAVTCTIKAHIEYDGVCQTQITRAKLEEEK